MSLENTLYDFWRSVTFEMKVSLKIFATYSVYLNQSSPQAARLKLFFLSVCAEAETELF